MADSTKSEGRGDALTPRQDDELGLSIDMLDVDRLREWARLLLVHGADIGHWASVPHVAGKMQTMATDLEKAVRDIGTLRARVITPLQSQPEKPTYRFCCHFCGKTVDGTPEHTWNVGGIPARTFFFCSAIHLTAYLAGNEPGL